MDSEKVKEIKKALEDCASNEIANKLPYIDDHKCKVVAFSDILTLINELESENKTVKNRITELEEGIAKSMLGCEFLPECTNDKLKQFSEKVLKFVKEYAFKDSKEIYTNGTILVPLFRVEYALETGGQDYQQG